MTLIMLGINRHQFYFLSLAQRKKNQIGLILWMSGFHILQRQFAMFRLLSSNYYRFNNWKRSSQKLLKRKLQLILHGNGSIKVILNKNHKLHYEMLRKTATVLWLMAGIQFHSNSLVATYFFLCITSYRTPTAKEKLTFYRGACLVRCYFKN